AEIDMNFGGYTIPKGATIFLYADAVHKDDKYFPDAAAFCPHRYTNPEVFNQMNRDREIVTFGHGRKRCTGELHARSQISALLASFVMRFDMDLETKEPENRMPEDHDGPFVFDTANTLQLVNLRQRAEVDAHSTKVPVAAAAAALLGQRAELLAEQEVQQGGSASASGCPFSALKASVFGRSTADLSGLGVGGRQALSSMCAENYWERLRDGDAAARADRALVLAAVADEGATLQFASAELRADREVVLTAIEQDSDSLRFAAPELRADREVVLQAVRKKGSALQHSDSSLWKDRELLLEAVRSDGSMLRLAYGTDLVHDRDLVLAAVEQDSDALEMAGEEFLADKEVVLAAVLSSGELLERASENLRADLEVVSAAIRFDGLALQFADPELRRDRDLVLAAVRQIGTALQFASDEIRVDPEVVREAVNRTPKSLIFALGGLQEDPELEDFARDVRCRIQNEGR
ncbi:unnamed protein product, partial [Polarella glacialis]